MFRHRTESALHPSLTKRECPKFIISCRTERVVAFCCFFYEKLCPEEVCQQRLNSLERLKCTGITSWHCPMCIWPALTTPIIAWCLSGMSWNHLALCQARILTLESEECSAKTSAQMQHASSVGCHMCTRFQAGMYAPPHQHSAQNILAQR